MKIVLAALCGFGMDLLLGDPAALSRWHPVVLMGRAIRALERWLRARFPDSERGLLAAGAVLAAALPLGTWLVTSLLLRLLRRLWPPLAIAASVIWCWQALAVKDLRDEALRVETALTQDGLEAGRRAVSRIVGRDTAALDEAGVLRAAVETVAENFSDGVIAPLFYMLIGGAPLALAYKAVNTMDSMVGYKNEKYLYFGRAAARLDDAANWLPARLAALLLIAAAFFTGENAPEALRIWRRDRHNHASPNAAQCEAAAAGALGLRLCGPAYYFGTRYDKPTVGDDTRRIEPGDIRRACRMEYAGSFLAVGLGCLLRLLLCLI